MSAAKLTIDPHLLDGILNKTIDTVTESQSQIFEISEHSRQEFQQLHREMELVKQQVIEVIHKSDRTEEYAKLARTRLAEVSKHFQKYSESDIRDAYENANKYQIELSIIRQTEKQLREKRDELERRIGALNDTVQKAESLAGQISVVLNYLNGDLRKINELVQNAQQKQEFGLQIIEAQEEERKRVSREIHDGPAQLMANVLIRSELLEKIFVEKGTEAARAEIKDLRVMVRNSLKEVRRIIYDLRPMALDDLGIVPTLDKYLRNVKESTGIEVELHALGQTRRFPNKMEIAIFRLVQESVSNAVKHSDAKLIEVKLEFTQKFISLYIRDDGKGFDMAQPAKSNSFGMMGMRERVELLEGTLKVKSRLNFGTSVYIQIPIQD
ncbi:sensor histidine kinase [Fictibacillus barbaricus]|uniref:Signal transduction histidine-protein kinase/phosphatase DegS n=1 Tax=Fictibacillus barbaricus TaxID=182136 RepID=A0ABS2ZEZ0_9BACL|nr:sensor histidine kinase [Fictibacillus barbaricus]MBN3546757.1 histidine kinase [Fictibacillus barbaricus]GGB43604.1 signal transduction histidine-protein kinase/phosphatase DegS [Fictibacillus barbaricus]